MRVVEIIDDIKASSGGTAVYIKHLLNFYNSNNIDILLVTDDQRLSKEVSYPGIVERLSGILAFLHFLVKNIRNRKNLVLHYNGIWSKYFLLTYKLALLFNYKVVLSPHGMLEPWTFSRNSLRKNLVFFFIKYDLEKFKKIHVTSKLEFNTLSSYSSKNLVLVNNCLNFDELVYSKEDSGYFLFLSRIEHKKGLDKLLLAYEILLKTGLALPVLQVAGWGDFVYFEFIKDLVKKCNLEFYVKFVGHVDGVEKKELLANAALFILPTYSENFGLAIAEALYSGVPVITTKSSSWDNLDLLNCGYSLNSNDPVELAEAIRDFLCLSDDKRLEYRKNSHNFIKNNYNCSLVLQEFLKVLID